MMMAEPPGAAPPVDGVELPRRVPLIDLVDSFPTHPGVWSVSSLTSTLRSPTTAWKQEPSSNGFSPLKHDPIRYQIYGERAPSPPQSPGRALATIKRATPRSPRSPPLTPGGSPTSYPPGLHPQLLARPLAVDAAALEERLRVAQAALARPIAMDTASLEEHLKVAQAALAAAKARADAAEARGVVLAAELETAGTATKKVRKNAAAKATMLEAVTAEKNALKERAQLAEAKAAHAEAARAAKAAEAAKALKDADEKLAAVMAAAAKDKAALEHRASSVVGLLNVELEQRAATAAADMAALEQRAAAAVASVKAELASAQSALTDAAAKDREKAAKDLAEVRTYVCARVVCVTVCAHASLTRSHKRRGARPLYCGHCACVRDGLREHGTVSSRTHAYSHSHSSLVCACGLCCACSHRHAQKRRKRRRPRRRSKGKWRTKSASGRARQRSSRQSSTRRHS